MKSLKEQLTDLVRAKGYVSYREAEQMCNLAKFGRLYKVDTFRRRADEVKEIQADGKDERGYVKGWKWVGEPIKYRQQNVLDHFGNVERVLTFRTN